MRVTQVLCAAGPMDAVTNQALAYRSLFRRWGWTGDDYAPVQTHDMTRGAIRPLHELRPAPGEPLVVHYSGYASGLERLLAACPRSLLVSHNITPPRYFWSSDPEEAVRCQLAYGQLAELARAAAGLVGVSSFNAAELRELSGREAAVIPVLFNRAALGAAGGAGSGPAPATILFVGRLVPHKRQDLVIRAFARLRQLRRPDARLVLVGLPLSPDYGAALAALAQELAPGAVSFETGLASAELWQRYRSAGAFLCLSEHEGFCIPLLEAFHFRVPVVARDAGAVSEVVGDAGVLLRGDDGVATIAELLAIVLDDGELRAELAQRGERRLQRYDHGGAAARVHAAVTELAAA
jgi:glycosyltransferase involved in cell wall biosynthesis